MPSPWLFAALLALSLAALAALIRAVLRKLRFAPTRVGGGITCPPGGPRCELRFSAPVFNE